MPIKLPNPRHYKQRNIKARTNRQHRNQGQYDQQQYANRKKHRHRQAHKKQQHHRQQHNRQYRAEMPAHPNQTKQNRGDTQPVNALVGAVLVAHAIFVQPLL